MVILALAGAVAAGAGVLASAQPEGGRDLDAATGGATVLGEIGPEIGPDVPGSEVRVIRVPADAWFAGGDRPYGADWDGDAHEDHDDHDEHGRDDHEHDWDYDEDDDD